ncbi:MAG: hypothetical protein WD032_11860 [Nitrospirales bacterium]
MHNLKPNHPLCLFWLSCSSVMFLLCFPAFAAEPIDGFRDLKFGMTAQDVQALPNCSTSHECLYELSDKNRYLQLTYTQDDSASSLDSTNTPGLAKITIDMGRFTEDSYHQLQVMMGNSYRLTHDFTTDTMNAFLAKELNLLQAGYEDGHVLLTVVRREFGNMTIKVIYQNTTLAMEFIRKRPIPRIGTP